jgi:hypothetical protein
LSASAESVEEREYEDYRYGRSARAILASKFQTLRRLKSTPAKVARLLPHIFRYMVLSVRQRAQMRVPMSCVLNPHAFVEHRHLTLTGIGDSGAIDCSFVREGKMTKDEALERERATRERVVDECQALVHDLGVKRISIELPS